MLSIDNSKERTKIKGFFDKGDLKFKNGLSLSEKQEGVNLTLQGLRLLKNLYEYRIVFSSKLFYNLYSRKNNFDWRDLIWKNHSYQQNLVL